MYFYVCANNHQGTLFCKVEFKHCKNILSAWTCCSKLGNFRYIYFLIVQPMNMPMIGGLKNELEFSHLHSVPCPILCVRPA